MLCYSSRTWAGSILRTSPRGTALLCMLFKFHSIMLLEREREVWLEGNGDRGVADQCTEWCRERWLWSPSLSYFEEALCRVTLLEHMREVSSGGYEDWQSWSFLLHLGPISVTEWWAFFWRIFFPEGESVRQCFCWVGCIGESGSAGAVLRLFCWRPLGLQHLQTSYPVASLLTWYQLQSHPEIL